MRLSSSCRLVDRSGRMGWIGLLFVITSLLAMSTPAMAASLSLGTYSTVVGPTAGASSDIVVTTGAWSATTNASWIHLTTASGTASGVAIFSYDANAGGTRVGAITFTGSAATVTLTVNQAGATFSQQSVVTTLVSGLNVPFSVAVDGTGNVYIADRGDSTIKEYNSSTQQVTTLVSSGLNGPRGVAVDGSGNVYIDDADNLAIKEWNASTQQVTTLVSSVVALAIAVDGAGNVYFCNPGGFYLQEYDPSTQQVTTLSSGPPTGGFPVGLAVDVAGNVYIADLDTHAIYEYCPITQQLTTLVSESPDPYSVAVDGAGNVYFSDDSNTLKEYNPSTEQLTTLVSSGLSNPEGVAVDGAGNIYIADTNHNAIKKYSPGFIGLAETTQLLGPSAGNSQVELATLPVGQALPWTATTTSTWIHLTAGSGVSTSPAQFTYDANPGVTRTGTISFNGGGTTLTLTQAGSSYVSGSVVSTLVSSGLNAPYGVAVDLAGNVYIADTSNNAIKEWSQATQQVTSLVSSGLNEPFGVAVDGAGNVYIADTRNNAIDEWNQATQQVTGLDIPGLSNPKGVAVDLAGNVYISATNNNAIKEWNASTQQVTTLVSIGLSFPSGVAVDANGNVYIADLLDSAIKEWNEATQQVTTLVPNGLNEPFGVAVDGAGNVYIGDSKSNAIREWNASTQQVTTLVSSGLNYPNGVAVDVAGNVYIADSSNNAIKKYTPGFIGPVSFNEPAAAGTDQLLPVLPSGTPLSGATSDQTWLTIGAAENDILSFSFTANPTITARVAHITVLGQSITVTQAGLVAPAISISNIPSNAVYGGTFIPNYSYSGNGTPSTASNTPNTCVVAGPVVIFAAPGLCSLTASATATASDEAVTGTPQSFTIAPATQTIRFTTNAPASAVYGSSFTVAASASSGLAVSFTSSGACSNSGATYTISSGTGTCLVIANQAGNTNYSAAPQVTETVTAALASQTISFTTLPASAPINSSAALSAKASANLAVSFTSLTPTYCTVSATTVSFIAAGTCTVQAAQTGNSNYAAAPSVTQTITVLKLSQTISFALPASPVALTSTPLMVNSSAGLAISYSSATPSVCAVTGDILSFLTSGTCTITGAQAGNATYNPATSVTLSTLVLGAPQTITFSALPTSQLQGTTVSLTASATSKLSVTFTSTTPTICTVSGVTATLTNPGTCTIQASQAGNVVYAAAPPVSNSLTVIAAFTITPVFSTGTAIPGGLAAFILQLQAASGFTGSVTLTCNANVSGSYCVDFPMTVKFIGGKALAASAIFFPLKTAAGSDTVTFIGTSGSITDSGSATIKVQ